MATAKSYSKTQIVLHWLIVLLVVFQFVAHDGIEHLWRERLRGAIPDVPTPDLHVIAGVAILLLMFWRIYLLVRNGAPAPSPNEPAWGRILAKSVQGLLYLSLFALPLTGIVGWFFGVQAGIAGHQLIKNLLLLLILVHIAGALAQQFVFKSDALMRMLGRA